MLQDFFDRGFLMFQGGTEKDHWHGLICKE